MSYLIIFLSVNTGPDEIIIMDERNIIILTCAYPTATLNVNWNITTPLSGLYVIQENHNNNSDYKLHGNGSIEIYHQFLFEKDFIVVKCSANNPYWSITKTFHLWEHETFTESMYVHI